MLPSTIAILLLLLLLLYSFINLRFTASPRRPKPPPGPKSLPIIGHLHLLGDSPHRTLQKLAKKYGPIMSMRLGSVPAVVVTSPQAAELFLKTHDAVLANRPKVQAYKHLTNGVKGIAFAEYGPYWRNVRRLCAVELLCPAKVEAYAGMRKEEVGLLVKSLEKSAAAREVVDVSGKVNEVIEEMTCIMLFGRSKEGFDLKDVIQETTRLAGTFNIADYFPWLGILDLQGVTRRVKATSRVIDEILKKIIDEHEQDASRHQTQHNGFINVMLSLINKPINFNDEKSDMIDRSTIKAIILDMLVGAIDTSSTAIEWAFSELLKNPRVMKKLQQELESVVGINRMVEETDLAKLIYLDMVVKESLRLHPVAPLLIPHESMEEITIEGYYIPKKSRVIVNIWAIGRDPNVWSDNAGEFLPERFVGSNIDVHGRDFQLIPFGSGRRKCPGIQLGLITVRLVLAQLLHCFDWEMVNGISACDLDMSEKFGLSLPRANHLLAMPISREPIKNI